MTIAAHVITVSDRCSRGEATDLSGPLAAKLLAEYGVEARQVDVVPDDQTQIQAAIGRAIAAGARLVFTTGGTGVSPRDVTPEATAPLLAARLDGVADAIRRRGEQHAPMACLSRGLVGITSRGPQAALVVNAPGSRGGVSDAVEVVGPLISHVIDQLNGGDHPR
ncbi:MogA/MoaB family molybdenum cofactor biosynthesis protein [Buchananella felis]|uniref:MogA/MoaB family molybdenum cofactor biosynthesis protein n=1 Tax=Buchananella felis TaxID=3231492 RepID=UPI0035285A19